MRRHVQFAMQYTLIFLCAVGAVSAWAEPTFVLNGKVFDGPTGTEGSFALMASESGPQILLARQLNLATMAVMPGEEACIKLPLKDATGVITVTADAAVVAGSGATVWLALSSGGETRISLAGGKQGLTLSATVTATDELTIGVVGSGDETAVRWSNVRWQMGDAVVHAGLFSTPATEAPFPALRTATLRPMLENELIDWDWRMQDGIGAGQTTATFPAAIDKTLARGDLLLADLRQDGLALDAESRAWEALRTERDEIRASNGADDDVRWEGLWQRIHEARRRIVFANPRMDIGPLVFVKQVPGVFSHQLTQYYGRYARPGGGVFVLEHPGGSMAVRQLGSGAFPPGSFMQPEVAAGGQRIIVAFCAVDAPPANTLLGEQGRYYHLYEIAGNGSQVRQLTDGAFNDFAPRELPNGQVVFISTRRGGWHRCGSIGCEVYTLTLMNADGSDIRTVSYHETQEWDPAVLNDGRVIYTRWDYIDRNAVHYQQLWTVRPDGTAPSAYYGNNTLNPVGVWEARAIPGSYKVMATAAPHHGMTAGSIILVDVTKGVDGFEPLTRLTPEVPFPESETPLPATWRATLAPEPPERTPETERWPGQCYRSAWPVTEEYFYAAYSYDPLIGEPKGNPANMFGLYAVDAFGNKELIYRDPNIASVWPMPLSGHPSAPAIVTASDRTAPKEGTYLLRNVYEGNTYMASKTIKALRIVQVLPKSTPGANCPPVGAANASPGKQVLGTVPVEADGSAHFRAPAGISLAFQALDETGQAVQIMRSASYLQPGEKASCIGCHESRMSAPAVSAALPMAARREPSSIAPGPDGSNPLSYPIMVQPVLDAHCIQCHGAEKPAGPQDAPVVLTAAPEGPYSVSYNALVKRVSFSAWGRGTFPDGNSEPRTQPGFFGAAGSPLMKMLLAGHHDVKLTPSEIDRFVTWMDANALFYGTFNPAEQERQRRGERINGPDLY